MRLLVDINVVLDVILEREPWVTEAALLPVVGKPPGAVLAAIQASSG